MARGLHLRDRANGSGYLAAIPGADVEPLGPLTRMTVETEGKSAVAILIDGLRIVDVDYVETQIDVALDSPSTSSSAETFGRVRLNPRESPQIAAITCRFADQP